MSNKNNKDSLPVPMNYNGLPDWYRRGDERLWSYICHIQTENDRKMFLKKEAYTAKVLKSWADRVWVQLRNR